MTETRLVEMDAQIVKSILDGSALDRMLIQLLQNQVYARNNVATVLSSNNKDLEQVISSIKNHVISARNLSAVVSIWVALTNAKLLQDGNVLLVVRIQTSSAHVLQHVEVTSLIQMKLATSATVFTRMSSMMPPSFQRLQSLLHQIQIIVQRCPCWDALPIARQLQRSIPVHCQARNLVHARNGVAMVCTRG